MKRYILGVEFFKAGNEEEHALVNGELMNLIDGAKMAVFDIPDGIEDEKEFLLKIVNQYISMLKSLPSEVIKSQLPKFYKASTTKQFWLHIFPDNFVEKHQINDEPVFEEFSLEANLETETDDSPTFDSIDIFIDFDGHELNGPPDRINFWETI